MKFLKILNYVLKIKQMDTNNEQKNLNFFIILF